MRERDTGNYSGATQGGDLGPNGKRQAELRGEGNSGITVSAVAAITTKGNSTPVVNAVCSGEGTDNTATRRMRRIMAALKMMMCNFHLAGQKCQYERNSQCAPQVPALHPATVNQHKHSHVILLYRLRGL